MYKSSGDACDPFGSLWSRTLHGHAVTQESLWQVSWTALRWPQAGGNAVAEGFAPMICGELENVQL